MPFRTGTLSAYLGLELYSFMYVYDSCAEEDSSEVLVGKIVSSLVDFDRSLRSLQQPVIVGDENGDAGDKKDEDAGRESALG